MKKISLLSLMLILTGLSMLAQTTFSVIPPRNVIAGNRFTVVYRLTNAEGHSLKAPQIDGCRLMYGPATSTSQSMQIINGVTTSSFTMDYSYTYRAEKEGTYTIPSATVIADGKKLSTDEVKFKVLPADEPQSGGQQGPTVGDIDSQSPDRPISKNDMFVRIILNKSQAYEQEAIECTLKLYTKYEAITSFVPTTPASYDGFLIDEVQVQPMLNDIENYNGQNHRTAVLKKSIIFPQKTGSLTINSGTYDVTVQQLERVNQGYFYYTRPVESKVKLQPFTAKINIKALPTPAPAGFNGAVGTFTASTSLSSDKLRTNEAASLTYTVKGTGNIKYLKDPNVEFPVEFEQYSPNQDFDTRVSGSNVTGTMTEELTFVPQSVGKFTITPSDFVFFNPSKGEYETITLTPYEVNVAKGVATTTTVEQQDIKLKNADILHIKLGDKGLQPSHTFIARQAWFWTLFPLLILAFVATVIAARRKQKKDSDISGRRKARASKVARQRLSAAARHIKSGEKEKFYEATLQAVWGYLSDKLNLPASALTRENVAGEIESYGAPAELANRFINILDDCEMARYTPDSSIKSMSEIYQEASDAMNSMENVKSSK